VKKTIFIFSSVLLSIVACKNEKGPVPMTPAPTSDTVVHYSFTIQPIVTLNCAIPHCHNAGSVDGDFTSYAGIHTKAANGTLLNRVVTLKNMPPTGPLSDADISRVNSWIQQGAPNN
jgi:hypothetical protein